MNRQETPKGFPADALASPQFDEPPRREIATLHLAEKRLSQPLRDNRKSGDAFVSDRSRNELVTHLIEKPAGII